MFFLLILYSNKRNLNPSVSANRCLTAYLEQTEYTLARKFCTIYMKTLVSRFDKKLIPQLPKVLFQGRIIVIQSKEEVAKAVRYLLKQNVLGIDTETKPVFKKGCGMNPVALLQVSTEDTCFLFRLNQIGYTDDLINLMSDNSVLKVGLSLKDDFMQLARRRSFIPGRHEELQSLVRGMGIEDQSLQKLYANFFAQRISKSQQLTNWEADVLTEAQKRYAATDAWACIQIYKDILRLEENGYMLEIVPHPEQPPLSQQVQEQKADKKEKKTKKEQDRRRRRRSKEKIHKRLDMERKDKEKLRAIVG